MFIVHDTKRRTHFEWDNGNQSVSFKFIAHNPSLLSIDENDDSVALCYGYIDQDKKGLTNAQFVTKQLKQNGFKKGLNQCYGSFIVINFNKHNHTISCANDALGDFALHYFLENKQIIASDLPSALLTDDNNQINHQRILDFFSLSQPVSNGSYFENVKQLNPGHCLIYSNNKWATERYYYPPTQINYQSSSLNELVEQFKKLIQQAIKWQVMQAEVSVMMSGGIDSTFVAANCLKAGKKVNSFSYVFPELYQADESQWISSMEALGINMRKFAGENYWPLKPNWHVSLNSPVSNPYRLLKQKVYEDVSNVTDKTILTGVFADHMYVAHIYWLVDLFKNKPLIAIKQFYSELKTNGIKNGLKYVSPAKWSKKVKSNPYWLTKKALKQYQKINKTSFHHPHPQQFSLVYGIDTAQSVWLENEYANKKGITIRHPYRDRRVVEFITTLPAWVIGSPNNSKLFVKNSSKGLLPDKILNRKTTTTLKPLFIKGVLQQELTQVKKLLTHDNCHWHEFIQKSIILPMLEKPYEPFPELHYLLLWKCISLELWLSELAKIPIKCDVN